MRYLDDIAPNFPCRFYEPNAWYKARITKPTLYPKMYVIDPDNHLLSLKERLAGLFFFLSFAQPRELS